VRARYAHGGANVKLALVVWPRRVLPVLYVSFQEFVVRLAHLPIFLIFLLSVCAIGCGGGAESKTLETNEIQNYIDANPEMAAKLKAREEAFAKPADSK
jgi:hypothetical protein